MNTLDLILMGQDTVSEETFDRFSKAEWIRWLNRGMEDISAKTDYLTWRWTLTTTGGKADYAYPDGCLRLHRLEYNKKELPPTDIMTLDANVDGWLSKTGPPEGWYSSWNNAFAIYPTPNTNYTIYIFGMDKGAVLVDDDDVPALPDQFHPAVALYAAYQILRADKELNTSASVKHDYFDILKTMKSQKKAAMLRGRGGLISFNRKTIEEG